MFKFDNTHIFTGYLKQLLSSFNLPVCKVYTKEFADYFEKHGKEDPRIVESFDNIEYTYGNSASMPRTAVNINYLKGNELYNFFWPFDQKKYTLGQSNSTWQKVSSVFYDHNKKIPGLTRVLNSRGNIYDTATHEYLGDYLRFVRDYYDVNLMSLYNCFNNKLCNSLSYRFNVQTGKANSTSVIFDSNDTRYHIYAFPVKLFADYTIAIDCDQSVEMFCGIYNTKIDPSAKSVNLITKTYQKVNKTCFKQPFLYDKLNVKFWNFEKDIEIPRNGSYPQLVDNKTITRFDIINREQDLKLFIKIPASCRSSIVVLEGDYRGFNDFKYTATRQTDTKNNQKTIWNYQQNHLVMNFNTKATGDCIDLNANKLKPISKLQLLMLNTGESYPFADRLVEYLCNSAITPMDEIADNIKRAQKVMSNNRYYFQVAGIWEDKMQKIIYDYMMNSGPIMPETTQEIKNNEVVSKTVLKDKRHGRHPRLGHMSKSTLYDVLGYVDKDAEKLYASWMLSENKAKIRDNIQNVDIYNGLYDI